MLNPIMIDVLGAIAFLWSIASAIEATQSELYLSSKVRAMFLFAFRVLSDGSCCDH